MVRQVVKGRRSFLAGAAAVVAAGSGLGACSRSNRDDMPARFAFGVASGDPLGDRVVLWTHAQRDDSTAPVDLTWQVSLDDRFAQVVAQGTVQATAATGFTVKVDATGLVAGNTYFYRFVDEAGVASATGTTRTLPPGSATAVKFAVFSCALYAEGYFDVYADAARSDAQYALHLGDYIYEYGADPAEFGNENAAALGRVAVPAHDCASLDDYRARHAQQRSDPDLQALHARLPWIVVWDDHDFADNAWSGGALNHDPTTQGDWTARKLAAATAYREWLPIREPDPADPLKIYRRFDFGSLLTLHMLDTRIVGRDQPYDSFGDADGGAARYQAGLAAAAGGGLVDGARHLLGVAQRDWLLQGLAGSNATWQVLGNQVILSRFWLPTNVLDAARTAMAAPTVAHAADVVAQSGQYLAAKATRALQGDSGLSNSQRSLLDPAANPRLPYNLDAWDGYPAERETVLGSALAQGKRLVALTGDTHNAWFSRLTTLAGTVAGVEFAGASVTSKGLDAGGLGSLGPYLDGTALRSLVGPLAEGGGLGLIDDVSYANTSDRGYMLVTVTSTAVTGQYVFVDTVQSRTFVAQPARTVTVDLAGNVTLA